MKGASSESSVVNGSFRFWNRFGLSAFALALLLGGCGDAPAPTEFEAAIPDSAEAVTPLPVGSTVPKVTLRTIDGAPVNLFALVQKKAAVLIFYRGGW